MARTRTRTPHESPLTELVARAAAGGPAGNLKGADLHAAVTALARITRVSVLERGVLATDGLRSAVNDIAARHLKRAQADRELSRVLQKIGDRQLRNAIEIAHDQVLEPSELAHYYAGLMTGLALLEVSRAR